MASVRVLAPHFFPQDCQCQVGLFDVRPYLDPGFSLDTTAASPCSSTSYFCDDGSACVSYAQGQPVSLAAGYWKARALSRLAIFYLGGLQQSFVRALACFAFCIARLPMPILNPNPALCPPFSPHPPVRF